MRSIGRLFVISLVALAFAAAGFAQTTPATPAKPAAPEKKMETKSEKPKPTTVTGEVTSVDAKAGMLGVKTKDKDKDKDLNLTAESKSTKSALGKVKMGDQVKVTYTEKNGKMVASSVAKAKAPAKAKEPAKTEEKKTDTKSTK
jgi:ribosomal protein S1